MDRKRLLPKLRHERWMGWTELPGRDLLKMPVKGLPRVGVGEDTRERYTFVQHRDLNESTTFAELEAISLANLAKRPGHWTVKEKSKGLLGIGARPLMLELMDEFSAERVLDVAFMTQAHDQLKSPLLTIAIPVRGIMWVRAAATDVATAGAFLELARKAFENAPEGLEPITPVVLTMQDGKLVGVVAGMSREGTPMGIDEDITPLRGFPWPVQGDPLADEASDGADEEGDDEDDGDDDGDEGRRLHRVGYDRTSKTIEYACHVDPGESIPDDEVALIAHIVKTGALGTSPVEVVRVACHQRSIAEQIAPQIRPTGAQIVFMNDAGEDEVLR